MTKHFLPAALFAVFGADATAAHATVTISSAPTANMSCSAGVCAPTAVDAVLNVGDLQTLLTSGDVSVTTTGSNVQANSIHTTAALTWPNKSALTLDAFQSVTIDKPVSVGGTGGLSLKINDGGSGGRLSFGDKGHITFANLSSPLSINGSSYTLVKGVKTLARAIVANPSGAYALAGADDASRDGTYKEQPVATAFAGKFEGLGNAISNLSMNLHTSRGKNDIVGMFYEVTASGSIADLRLDHLRLKARAPTDVSSDAGGLVGNNLGVLEGDEVSGSAISQSVAIGGLTAGNSGTIEYSSADVSINARDGGGIVAVNAGTISLSHAAGSLSGGGAGGLAYFNTVEGTITQSYATGNVSGLDVGGLISVNQGEIDNSYATGTVTGTFDGSLVGGMAGEDAAITTSYSTGMVGCTTGCEVGGFVGRADFVHQDDYWDTTTSGTDQGTGDLGNGAGITGLTSRKLKSGLPSGFDSSIWAEDKKINNGFPYLINNPPEKK
ncbi:MAG TPA: GLUG motif-containing protein [Rhizomicrobium sp.]